jgi:hypothetical protein
VDLAHVVQNPGECEAIEVVTVQPEAATQIHTEVGHAMNVPVQVLDDVFHHLDEEFVRKLSHSVTT